jgi:hypothetical protein
MSDGAAHAHTRPRACHTKPRVSSQSAAMSSDSDHDEDGGALQQRRSRGRPAGHRNIPTTAEEKVWARTELGEGGEGSFFTWGFPTRFCLSGNFMQCMSAISFRVNAGPPPTAFPSPQKKDLSHLCQRFVCDVPGCLQRYKTQPGLSSSSFFFLGIFFFFFFRLTRCWFTLPSLPCQIGLCSIFSYALFFRPWRPHRFPAPYPR